MPESSELHEARRLLSVFEQNSGKPEGIIALAEALAVISDLRDSTDKERERRVADNLFKTYAQKAEEHAQTLLANLDSIQDDDLEHWYEVMHEFVIEPGALPATFAEKKNELITSLGKRIFKRVSAYEQQLFLSKLRSIALKQKE